MEASNSPTRPDSRTRSDHRLRSAPVIATIAVATTVAASVAIGASLAGCAPSRSTSNSSTTLADWCWAHYRLAPSTALAFDDGPATLDDAVRWSEWLDATSPAPAARSDAHRRQVELVGLFRAEGGWTESERGDYSDAALSDPTPATACEAIGARIVPTADGSLPDGWERRFDDAANPAWSRAASSRAASTPAASSRAASPHAGSDAARSQASDS